MKKKVNLIFDRQMLQKRGIIYLYVMCIFPVHSVLKPGIYVYYTVCGLAMWLYIYIFIYIYMHIYILFICGKIHEYWPLA